MWPGDSSKHCCREKTSKNIYMNSIKRQLRTSQKSKKLKWKNIISQVSRFVFKVQGRFWKNIVNKSQNEQGAKPTKQPPRRLPHHTAEFVDKMVENMLERSIVQPSSSPWAAEVVLVEKKDDIQRFCVDYRSLKREGLTGFVFQIFIQVFDM